MAEDDDDANVNISYGKRLKLSSEGDVETGSTDIELLMKSLNYLHLYFNVEAHLKLKTAIIFDDGKGRAKELSYEALDVAANCFKQLIENSLGESQFIGVMCDLGTLYPVLILGILRNGKAFFNIDSENWGDAIADGVKYLNLKYIICECESIFDSKRVGLAKLVLEWLFPESNLKCFVYEVTSNPNNCKEFKLPRNLAGNLSSNSEIAYAIQTSGTTGKRKMVLVPHSCICPNIQSFIHTNWNVSHEDVIFGAAPPTFDPHVVELFTALGAGATIVYSTTDVKSDSRLVNLLRKYCVTISQVTPSVFRRMSLYLEKEKGLHTIRIVAFGGEKCVTKQELKEILRNNIFHPNIIFQNIYGVTEVSCWASVCNINLQNEDPITVGKGITETEVSIELMNSEDVGEIVIKSSTRYCHIIDPSNSNGESLLLEPKRMRSYEYRTGDVGRATKFGIVFEGRDDRMVKRNGMKVSLYEIEEMTYSTGLVSFAECRLYTSKIYLLIKLKPEYEVDISTSSNSVTLVPFLSSKLELPLFMYPDVIISMKCIPLNTNGKIDFPCIINYLMTKDSDISGRSTVPFSVSWETLIKTVLPVWKSCTWPGERSSERLLTENFHEAGGTSISAARFIESVFMSVKLFGSQIHQTYEKELLARLTDTTFASVVDFLFSVICTKSPITANVSDLNSELLLETQDSLSNPTDCLTGNSLSSEFEFNMLDTTMIHEDLPVFNDVDLIESAEECIALPLRLINMYDFTLGLCVDASPAVTNRDGYAKDRAVVGCHGGVLLCIDLNVLRRNPRLSNLAIAWKRRLPSRIEAAVAIDENGLYGYVGCHDCNFYKFSIVSGALICSTLCHAPIRSKADLCEEHEIVVFLDADNCIYGVNCYDLNIIWTQRSFRLLATVTPLIVGRICCVTTLDKGLIALDIRTGKTTWGCDIKNDSYSSPTLGYMAAIVGNKKRRPVIISGTLDPSHIGVDIRDVKTGRIAWQYKTPSISPSVNSPLFSKCCDKIIWISPESQLIIFNPQIENGYDLSLTLHQSNITCSLISGYDAISKSKECVLFYIIPGRTCMASVRVQGRMIHEINPWFLKQDFETFSKPSTSNEFILFGGRDNKLHVIKCLTIRTNCQKLKM
ncbi:unnamed protein product [Orchesella dallaii]|uniref:AMP-dependent synthetase/ligase domain-containing protein n=1 Tax=Orchesella dallaii TaxID=48710 RepID=A0ABP1S5W3_9HEXA